MAQTIYEVTAEGLNVREEPSIHGKILTVLQKGAQVELISISGDDYWHKVLTAGGIEGWAAHKYLRLVPDAAPNLPAELPWLAIAFAEIGSKEFPGASDNPRVIEYLHSTNLPAPERHHDETAWCSAFVNWCMERAGFEGTDSAWAKAWLNWGKEIKKPRKGCIAVFTREGGGHVGFYMGQTQTAIKLLGGNQDDAVNIANYPKSRLLGYRLPGTLV